MAVRPSEILSNLFFPSIKKILVIPAPTEIQALIFRKYSKITVLKLLYFFHIRNDDLKYPVFIFIHYKKSFEIYTHSFQTTFLLPSYPYLTATAAFAAAAAAIAFFRFEYEFSQEEEYAGEHNQADDNILSHHIILEVIW